MKPLLLLMLIPFAGAESCPQMPCKNGGTCLNHSNGTSSCLCPPGYVGDTCQFADPCTPVLCQNGGTCSSRALPPSAAPEYICVCPPGFTGEKCQGVVGDPCFPSPCQHGGTCQRVSGKDHQCQCLSGWTGKNCQLMDFCPANPCANGGTCVITYPVIVCQCWPGFEGHTCQHDINECFGSPSPCLNGGSCVNSIGSFRCFCPPNFTGPLCQYQLGPCSPEICLHGGTCHHVDERYHGCLCLPGNYGSLLLALLSPLLAIRHCGRTPKPPKCSLRHPRKEVWMEAFSQRSSQRKSGILKGEQVTVQELQGRKLFSICPTIGTLDGGGLECHPLQSTAHSL